MRNPLLLILSPLGVALLMIVGLVALFEARDPAPPDVRGLTCRWNFTTHTVAMTATVVNDTSDRRDYAYQVDYLTKAGKRVGSGTLIVNKVQPGQTASVTGLGDFVPGEVPARCVIGLD